MKKLISLLVIPLVMIACNQKQADDGHGHSHGHGGHSHGAGGHSHGADDAHAADEKFKETLYNDTHEIFVEFDELVVGDKSTFLAHYTRLDNFRPSMSGKFYVEAHKGGKVVYRSKKFKMKSPGIYEGDFVVKSEGTYDLVFVLETRDGKISKHTRKGLDVHDHAHGVPGHGHEHGEEVTFLKEQAWDVGIQLYNVKLSDFNYAIKTSGKVLPSRGNFEIITAKSSGIVKFVQTQLDNGSEVKKGTSLFRISGKGLLENNIDNKYVELKSNFEKNKAEFERKSTLYQERIVSAKEYEEAKAQYESDKSKYDNLVKKYNKSGVAIKAGIKGNIYDLAVNDGDFVEEGQEIARIISSNKVRIQVDIPLNNYDLVKDIYSMNFKPAYGKKVYTMDEVKGKIISKGNTAAENSGFVPVIFEVESSELVAGSFVECWVHTKKLQDKFVIPKSALVEEQGNYYLYATHGGETYLKQVVTILGDDGKNVMVGRGAWPGQWIVSKGAIYIKVASTAGTMPVHSH